MQVLTDHQKCFMLQTASGIYKQICIPYYYYQQIENKTRKQSTNLANIDNNRVIASQMILPIFISYFFIWPTLLIFSFYIWFGFHTIEILMEPIQQKSKEFLQKIVYHNSEYMYMLYCVMCATILKRVRDFKFGAREPNKPENHAD